MTPAKEYLSIQLGSKQMSGYISIELAEIIMNNFAYTTLKNLYNSLGKEMSSDLILETISNYKAKFHQCDTDDRRSTKADSWVHGPQ